MRKSLAPSPLTAAPTLPSLRGGPTPARIGNISVGTASWTDQTLIDSATFYPPGVVRPADRLRYYARHFPVVEVDATFYALPTARNAAAWVERTPPDFAFGVKAFAAMTGHPFVPARLPPELRARLPRELATRRSVYPRDLPREVLDAVWQAFRDGVAPLQAGGVLAYVLLQFPRWFRRSPESVAALEAAAERLAGLRVAVEFREASWIGQRTTAHTLADLRRLGLVYVCVDEPQGTPASVPPLAVVTSDELAVVRFHGRRAGVWDRPGVGVHERFGYLYQAAELGDWVPRIRALAGDARQVHALMNNCYRQYAVQNAKDLASLLAEGAS